MDAGPFPIRFKLPTEPYPGLRPFLDHEAALLFGRARQVGEIVERLRQTQFVAVIGGSGSGKSSLIRGGVVPELRSFGIPGAGDFWLPVVCTPGTNVCASAPGGGPHTPIGRLTWKFAKLLKSRGSDEADAARLVEIANVFRQEAGFARLVEAYADELSVSSGLDGGEARLLFVIDQFEELFHPTNKSVEDCRLMVERVIDHYFDRHPRCYVVLTMRSEHLNDCACFLELPDAINKSFYLVRRLDEAELREAVVSPAQRYLRLLARQYGEAESLPESIMFEPRVVERVLRDVQAIAHDPDHLPLLQHLLARVWECACERAGNAQRVPDAITWADLTHAVAAGADSGLEDKTNALRASLEHWAEALYARRSPEQQAQLEAMLRRLAFKDPNTGQYSQQRVNVDDCACLLGAGRQSKDLWGLIEDGYVGSVDYLFWDDENPALVTLKVSHESFIRGWSRFRRLIDEEADRFEEFVALLRACAKWQAKGCDERLLVDGAQLARTREMQIERMLGDASERGKWFRLLLLDRDAARLVKYESSIDAFLHASLRKQAAAESSRARTRLALFLAAGCLLVFAPISAFFLLVQRPAMERAAHLFDASNIANQVSLSDHYEGVGGAADELVSLIRAAEAVELGLARADRNTWMAPTSRWLLEHIPAGIGPVEELRRMLQNAASQAEPQVNGKLRSLLTTALWPARAKADGDESINRVAPRAMRCIVSTGSNTREAEVEGRLFLATGRDTSPIQRGIFILVSSVRDSLTVYGASIDPSRARPCHANQVVMTIPNLLEPRLVFDAGLRYMMMAAAGPYVERPAVTLYEINWDRNGDGKGWGVAARPVTVVVGEIAAEQVRKQAEAGGTVADVLESWRTADGRAFSVSGTSWHMVSSSAVRIDVESRGDLSPLQTSPPGSHCQRLGDLLQRPLPTADIIETRMLETEDVDTADAGYCFAITQVAPGVAGRAAGEPGDAQGIEQTRRAPVHKQRLQVMVAVYAKPTDEQLGQAGFVPAPIASLPQFARYAADSKRGWFVGKGDHNGWILVEKQALHYIGAPWSTEALLRLSRKVLEDSAAKPAQLPDGNRRASGSGGGA